MPSTLTAPPLDGSTQSSPTPTVVSNSNGCIGAGAGRLDSTFKPTKFERDIILGDITKHNTNMMRLINERAFPVTYHDKFYEEAATRGEFAKLAFFQDVPVGAVCCRVEPETDATAGKKLYIMTLGCLPAFRRCGLGTAMLKHVFTLVDNDPTITSVYLHVQVNNQDAINFYERYGFNKVSTVENYYKNVEPADGYVVEKRVRDRPATTVTTTTSTGGQSSLTSSSTAVQQALAVSKANKLIELNKARATPNSGGNAGNHNNNAGSNNK